MVILSGLAGAILGAGIAAAAPWRNAGLAVLNSALDRQAKQIDEQAKEIAGLRLEMANCERERNDDRATFAAELVDLRQRLDAATA